MKKIRMKNQILSLILVIVMIIGCFPVTGMATVSSAPPTKGERGESRIEARGTPITIEAGTESGKTVVWYGDSSNKTYVTDNGAAGEDLSNYIIYAGYYNLRDSDDAALTGSITMTGGTVKGIVAANLNGIQPMTTELRITGGQVEDIYFASVSGSNTGTAFGYITVSSDPWYEGNFTDGIYKSEEDEWILIGSAQIPAGENLTIAEGETLTVDRGEVLTNNGTIRNSGSLIINGSFVDNGTVDNTGIITRNAAYIVTDAEGAVTVLADGKSVSPITEYVDGKLYLYDIRGRIKATLNGKDYCGIQTDGSSTQLIEGYSMVTDISGIPESLNVNRPTTLAAVLSPAATTFDTEISYTLTDAGTTQAVLSGNVLTAYNSGTVKLLVVASDGLESYSETFTIPVTYKAITGLSSTLPASVIVGSKILLPKVTPTDASYQEIQWSVLSGQEETGATIANGYLVLTKEGTATVQATVKNGKAYGEDYTETFSVTATGITGAIDISQGDVSIEENTDGSFRVTYSGFSGGYKDYKENEWIAITGSTDKYKIEVLSGNPNIALSDCSISHSKSALSLAAGTDVALTLVGTNVLKGTDGSGIYVPVGAVITIGGEGSLSATGGDRHAAIGGMGGASRLMGAQGSGTITINSGTITAQGGYQATGIGAGRYNANGTVIINGGVVTATGGAWAAGIGGGYINDNKTYITGGIIEINGGFVTATGGELAAGIGGSQRGSGNKVTITGGTVVATGGRWGAGIGGGGYGSGGTVVISGGNVLATRGSDANDIGAGNKGSGITLTDANENSISKNTITLDGAAADTAVTAAAGLSYGLKDVKTLNTNQLYFYLPSGAAASSITAGEKVYDCTEDNQTYYASHDWSKNDSECTRCGETCEHENQTGSTCEICGTALHTHNWTYTQDGNKITATCDATGCPNPVGGSVTISEPSDLTYTGSKIEAVVDNTLTTDDAVKVEYYGNTTGGYPVNVGEYTASITLGDAIISVEYTIAQATPEIGTVTANELYNTLDASAVTLTKTDTSFDGALALVETELRYGTNTYNWTFTPDNSNYKKITGTVEITVKDTVAPTAQHKIGTNGWKQFVNFVSFGIFCKDYGTLEIQAADENGSGVKKIEYYISTTQVADVNTIKDTDWKAYTDTVSLDPHATYYIYVRVTDNQDNSAVYSEGVVVYEDSKEIEAEVYTTYGSTEDFTVTVELNGNTIKDVRSSVQSWITTGYCTVDGDTIKLNGQSLARLGVGAYPITVYYNPMGVENSGVTDLATTTFTVIIDKAEIKMATVDVTAPEAGAAKQTAVAGGTGYSATISWNCDTEKFGYNTAYTATVTITADKNHKFASDLSVNGWNVDVSNDGDKATLTKTFEATRKEQLTEIGTPDNAVLDKYYTNVADAIKELPTTVTYTVETGSVTVGIEWTCGNYDPTVSKTNEFVWKVKDGELADYDANGIATTGKITVTNADAIAVDNKGENKATIYNGNTYDVSEMFTKDENAGEASYTIIGGTGEGTLNGSKLTITKAGTFEIKLTTAANGAYAAGSATATLTVSKGDGSGSVEISGWTYGEDAKAPVVMSSTNGIANVTYLYESTDGKDYSSSNAPKNAGSYKLTVTFAETDLHAACTDDATFTVEKKQITASITGSVSKVYDGTNSVPTGLSISLSEIVGTDDVTATASYAYDGVNVGTTNINATNIALSGVDAGNYNLTATTASANVGEITAKSIADATVELGDALTYTGSEQVQTVTVGKLDGLTVTYDVSGNTQTEVGFYTLTVTAKGNFKGTLSVDYCISPNTSLLEGLTDDNVTSDAKADLEKLLNDIDAFLNSDKLTEDEKAELKDAKENAESLVDVIEAAVEATSTENTEKVKDVTAENVTSENKTDLENAKADLEKAIEDNGGNYTEDEKKAIEDEIDRIDKAIATLEKVEAVEDKIGSLPENITKNDEAAIKAADEALGALSDYEKSLVDKDAKKALDDAKAALAQLNKPADTTYPNTGDNVNLWLWFALLFVSGGGLFGAAAYKKRQQVKEN